MYEVSEHCSQFFFSSSKCLFLSLLVITIARITISISKDKTGFQPANSKVDGAVNILLKLDNAIQSTEGYELKTDVNLKEINITAKTETGTFYGIQTLLSMLVENGNRVPRVHLYDEPRYEFRGMHIDISRNFQSKTTLLRTIDAMATYKLNKLHLHATDDEGWRIEIKDLPELTEVMQMYTPMKLSIPSDNFSN